MTPGAETKRTTLTVAGLWILALIPRLALTLRPIPAQLNKFLADDSFYYFLTARNIVRGLGPSIDGIHASNGWHPLWLIINLPIFAPYYENLDVPVYMAVILGALLDSLIGVTLYLILRRRLGEGPAVAAGALYALNSRPVFEAVGGLETGLAALCIALAWITTLRLLEIPSVRRSLAWGAAFGLCVLARTDTAVILVWLGFYALFKLPAGDRWRLTLIGAAVAILLTAPWFGWNLLTFGSIMQTSSMAAPWALAERYRLVYPDRSLWQLSVETLGWPAGWFGGVFLGTPTAIGFVMWAAGAWALIRARSDQEKRLRDITLLLLAGGLCLVLIHTLIRRYPRHYYFIVTVQSVTLALALFWHALRDRRFLLQVAGAVVAAGMLTSGWLEFQLGHSPWQSLQYDTGIWIAENLPEDAVIGSLNAGIIAYYSQRTTVNLDGAVNPSAVEAIHEKQLMRYMQTTGIDYFADGDRALAEYGFFMGPGFPEALREVAVIGEHPAWGKWRVYAVEGR